MSKYYCMMYGCEIERINKNEGVDPAGDKHSCFTRKKGGNPVCSALIVLPNRAEIMWEVI